MSPRAGHTALVIAIAALGWMLIRALSAFGVWLGLL